ncbi:hemolysin family protein [Agrobacterium sp. SHOUNA12C]|uniref:Hemolysin protein n=2 Tax=Rhizobium rhizogenes TaxID=359 RepID=B9JDX6_RHIR8|nr:MULTISPECIES: hemolysin family protein [Rhizobium]ACM26327.1 hemolysin protein [Rhizobium rhizogenes K84]KAA6490867.1 HlyC/CorC family transporter [Agrobacterium sp. ICMP 7243]MCJ9722620.1 hemolysin family protein [Agrobacterium sp. BETTINA12B]MCJ9756949.1 hemolysin family protein [Agrobacterium sp. SHOUNA12C]OCJ06318.1 DNA-binding protein [Agrobacterium sp. 13-626]OCJ25423.1 DNA-binding protein [Agrobacterium sp. B131/95]OCJ31431.1 DNA-binding protein [Agrobacterium sp. B133/95]
MFLEISIVVLLTILNGVLAMSELAVVSARPARLKVLADQGSRGARLAIRLIEHPGRFLSTVQIGITLVGVLSGAFSGATLGARFTNWLVTQGMSQGLADALGVGTVVVAITYLSLIVGELVPKQIALRAPETVASKVAPAMTVLSKLALPLVWLLDASGRLVLSLLGQSGKGSDGVTDEEIKTILAEAQSAGVIESEESAMISGVMRLADRTARALMTPRREVELIDVDDSAEEIRTQLHRTNRSQLPVRRGSSDEVLGVLFVKDYYDAMSTDGRADIKALTREVPVVSDLATANTVIQMIRTSPTDMVLVFDEYGHFEGVVTSGDIMEAIMGVFQTEHGEEPAIARRDDGSYLVSGWMPIDEFSEFMNIPLDEDAEYQTVAGLVLEELKHLPELGESFSRNGWRFEVIDLDGRRIDKLLLSPEKTEAA